MIPTGTIATIKSLFNIAFTSSKENIASQPALSRSKPSLNASGGNRSCNQNGRPGPSLSDEASGRPAHSSQGGYKGSVLLLARICSILESLQVRGVIVVLVQHLFNFSLLILHEGDD